MIDSFNKFQKKNFFIKGFIKAFDKYLLVNNKSNIK